MKTYLPMAAKNCNNPAQYVVFPDPGGPRTTCPNPGIARLLGGMQAANSLRGASSLGWYGARRDGIKCGAVYDRHTCLPAGLWFE